ncbi:MAG: hypothetical protein INR64_07300 [Caulobacteraceae bacterium]|nr:hypothetical protein [Caulobacter sp.]
MARYSLHRFGGVFAGAALLASAPAGWGQPPARATAAPVAAASPAQDDHAHAEDRVFALVQAGKCAQAKAAALQDDDSDLAGQIGLMCGAKPSGAYPEGHGQSGGRHGGGGGGRGRGGS